MSFIATRHIVSIITIYSLMSVIVSCSSSRVYQTSGSSAPISGISDVIVSVRSGSLDADNESYFRANSMSGAIRSALTEELRKNGKLKTASPKMEFEVTDFRLRSGSAVFWVGVMAGGDYLAGIVRVRENGQTIKTFEASAKGNESAWSGMATGRLTASQRADLFCSMIARDIVRQL